MKKFIQQSLNTMPSQNTTSAALLLLRIAVGAMMITHGWGKLTMLFGDDPVAFVDPLNIGLSASLFLAVFAEVLCSLFLVIGFATRFSALCLLVTMLIAAFVVHANDPFSGKEMALLYLLLYVVLAIAGAGKYSVDHLLSKPRI